MANSLTESRRRIILNSPHIASASGSIVTVNDAIKAKLKSCVVDINPVQSGIGNPSHDNIRPISGWTECNIACGDNFYNSNGTVSQSTAGMRVTIISKNEIVVTNTGNSLYPASKQNTSIYNLVLNDKYAIKTHIKSETGNANPIVSFRNQNNTVITSAVPKNDDIILFFDATQQIKDGYLSFFAAFGVSGNQSVDYSDIAFQSAVSIAFPSEAGTIYGGTLDATNGVLMVTDACIDSYNGETLPSTWISDRDVYAEGATPTTGAQVVYKLATPVTYQLTPTQIQTIIGDNYIWADTGDISVKYWAHP